MSGSAAHGGITKYGHCALSFAAGTCVWIVSESDCFRDSSSSLEEEEDTVVVPEVFAASAIRLSSANVDISRGSERRR